MNNGLRLSGISVDDLKTFGWITVWNYLFISNYITLNVHRWTMFFYSEIKQKREKFYYSIEKHKHENKNEFNEEITRLSVSKQTTSAMIST